MHLKNTRYSDKTKDVLKSWKFKRPSERRLLKHLNAKGSLHFSPALLPLTPWSHTLFSFLGA